jgi:glycosyltransferase involved in cell wall biosynthesis
LLSFDRRQKGIARNWRHLARVWTANNWIAKRYRERCDIVYSPGYLVQSNVPYVVEVDNVSILAYYKLTLLKLAKPFIRHQLREKRCRSIVCISRAAQLSIHNYFHDARIDRKCIVVHPYVGAPLPAKKPSKEVTFLFVATNFYLKGGKEVVHAFEELALPNTRLVMVTQRKLIDRHLRERMERNSRVTLVEANLDKAELFHRFYQRADVFVVPTYQDSFGMVFLEALRCGLPIITTRMFATPEMVEHTKNGFVYPSPIPYFSDSYLPNPRWWERDKARYAKNNSFPALEHSLVHAMRELATKPALRARMSAASHALLRNRFSEHARQEALLRALHGEL